MGQARLYMRLAFAIMILFEVISSSKDSSFVISSVSSSCSPRTLLLKLRGGFGPADPVDHISPEDVQTIKSDAIRMMHVSEQETAREYARTNLSARITEISESEAKAVLDEERKCQDNIRRMNEALENLKLSGIAKTQPKANTENLDTYENELGLEEIPNAASLSAPSFVKDEFSPPAIKLENAIESAADCDEEVGSSLPSVNLSILRAQIEQVSFFEILTYDPSFA